MQLEAKDQPPLCAGPRLRVCVNGLKGFAWRVGSQVVLAAAGLEGETVRGHGEDVPIRVAWHSSYARAGVADSVEARCEVISAILEVLCYCAGPTESKHVRTVTKGLRVVSECVGSTAKVLDDFVSDCVRSLRERGALPTPAQGASALDTQRLVLETAHGAMAALAHVLGPQAAHRHVGQDRLGVVESMGKLVRESQAEKARVCEQLSQAEQRLGRLRKLVELQADANTKNGRGGKHGQNAGEPEPERAATPAVRHRIKQHRAKGARPRPGVAGARRAFR